MKALLVVYCYPPLLAPAALCYLKLVVGLRAAGVDVEILRITPTSFQNPGAFIVDEDLEAVIPKDVVEHAVDSPESTPWIRLVKRLDPSRRVSRRWLEPKKREWTYPAERLLRRMNLEQYDVLVTCSQPHANHLLGLFVRDRSRLPWIAYFSDPWTSNPYVHYPSDRLRTHNRRLEERVVRGSDLVLYTCEEMRRHTAANLPILGELETGTLPHCFVPDWYDIRADHVRLDRRARTHLLYTGGFYGPRTPLPLIESLKRLGLRTDLERELCVDIYGSMEPHHREQVTRAGLDGVIRFHPLIPYLDSLALMRVYDALLVVDAPLTTTNESVFLPSKLVDYLGAGKPLVAITPQRGATARVVGEVGGMVCPIERPESIDGSLLELTRGSRSDLPKYATNAYGYVTVGRKLRGLMERTIRQVTRRR